jgi:hypothetical protein
MYSPTPSSPPQPERSIMNYRMKWATRVGIHIDRAACTGLIRRSLARTRHTTCPKPVSAR